MTPDCLRTEQSPMTRQPTMTPFNDVPQCRHDQRAITAFSAFALAMGGCIPCSAQRPFSRNALTSRRNLRPAVLFPGGFFSIPCLFPCSQGNDGPAEMPRIMRTKRQCTVSQSRYKQAAFCRKQTANPNPANPDASRTD
jgi:hypothetical protein